MDCRLLVPGLVSDTLAEATGTVPLVDAVESAHYGEIEAKLFRLNIMRGKL